MVDAVGEGVSGLEVGDRVWVFLAQHDRPGGTAAEFTVQPANRVVLLPEGASYDVGASLGVPAMTAHRALTVHEDGPDRLAPGALDGRVVLVTGGAGAVGHAAIQLARWAGATVVTTVSSEREGSPRHRRRRPPRRRLHQRRSGRRDPRDRPGRRRPGRRGRPDPERRPAHPSPHDARLGRGVRQHRRHRGHAALPDLHGAQRADPVRAALHRGRGGAPGRRRGRHRGRGGRRARGRRGVTACR